MVEFTKGSGFQTKCMALGSSTGRMGGSLRVNTAATKNTEKASFGGKDNILAFLLRFMASLVDERPTLMVLPRSIPYPRSFWSNFWFF